MPQDNTKIMYVPWSYLSNAPHSYQSKFIILDPHRTHVNMGFNSTPHCLSFFPLFSSDFSIYFPPICTFNHKFQMKQRTIKTIKKLDINEGLLTLVTPTFFLQVISKLSHFNIHWLLFPRKTGQIVLQGTYILEVLFLNIYSFH